MAGLCVAPGVHVQALHCGLGSRANTPKGVIIVRLRFLRYLLIAGIVAVGLVGVGAVSGRVHFKAAGLSAAAGAGAGAAGAGAASRCSGRSSQRRSYGSSGSGVSSRSKGSKSSYGGSMI